MSSSTSRTASRPAPASSPTGRSTAFFFVLVPEEMIILDTVKAAELFSRFKVPISGYIVNRVLPTEL